MSDSMQDGGEADRAEEADAGDGGKDAGEDESNGASSSESSEISYSRGDLIWVRIKGFPWWPAVVVNESDVPPYLIKVWRLFGLAPDLHSGTKLIAASRHHEFCRLSEVSLPPGWEWIQLDRVCVCVCVCLSVARYILPIKE